MEKFDIEKLKKETQEAIRKGEEAKERESEEKHLKEQNRISEAKTWAEYKALSVPSLTMKAAKRGANRATICDTYNEYGAVISKLNNFVEWDTKGIGLRYSILEKLLKEMGFEVEVVFQHDGIGIRSWYNIDVVWWIKHWNKILS